MISGGLLLCALLWSGAGAAAEDAAVAASIEQIVERLDDERAARAAGLVAHEAGLLGEFYRSRGFVPTWDRDRARALEAFVRGVGGHGLDPADYRMRVGPEAAVTAANGPRAKAVAEVQSTAVLLRLATHLRFGRTDPRATYRDWNFGDAANRRLDAAALAALLAAPDLGAALAQQAPRVPLYLRLQEALSRHHAIEAAGGWARLPPGPLLRPGARDARVPALRERLVASGDLAPDPAASATHHAADLVAAVRRFQSRHGLDPDGIVGEATRRALNVDVRRRIEQLRVNLERVRWIAGDLAGDYLLVDIAGFTARLYVHGQLAWRSRVVVGRPFRSTPAFKSSLQSIVLNPTWTVPPTILREDILPQVLRDPGYLARNAMRLVGAGGVEVDPATVDWTRWKQRLPPFEIVQAPGPANPLGALKFVMPNRHAVFLHDTPSRELFARADRAASSGCIRVEDARALAVALLSDPERWSDGALGAAIASGETRSLAPARRVPVLLLYITADVDDRGRVHFHPDLYGRDAVVAAALRGAAP